MKILLVNKYYYLRGGAEKYLLETEKALIALGHEVAIFAMDHPNNLPSKYQKYFVTKIEFNRGGLKDKLLSVGRVIYSLQAKKKFAKLLDDFQPDIIHLHNIYHQLSPSILPEAKKRNIPMVMHLHDYKLICPNYQLFANREICTRCKPKKYYQCVKQRCFKNSFSQSLLATVEMYLHHVCSDIYLHNINCFIAPSNFMKQKCVEFGIPEIKIKVLLNFATTEYLDELMPQQPEDYLLYFGRLSQEKGIEMITKLNTTSIIKILGNGPIIKSDTANIKFLGEKYGTELKTLIKNSQAIIFPSIWAENMPFAIIESMALGKTVIAANTGGIPELITHGKTGLLFQRADQKSFQGLIDDLNNYDLQAIGKNAKNFAQILNLPEHLKKLLIIYQENS